MVKDESLVQSVSIPCVVVKDESLVQTVFHFSMLSWQQWWSRTVYLKKTAVVSLDKWLGIVAPVSGIDRCIAYF